MTHKIILRWVLYQLIGKKTNRKKSERKYYDNTDNIGGKKIGSNIGSRGRIKKKENRNNDISSTTNKQHYDNHDTGGN